MALTLTEGAKLSNDVLRQGVIETIVNEDAIFDRLPFIEIVGNALTYNRENAPATAAFYNVGDTWAESTPTFTQQTATLKILGGDADVDRYIARTRSNVQDIEATVVELKAKAVAEKFRDTAMNGDTAVDTKAFDGLNKICAVGQTASMGTNGAVITLEKLDEMIDLIRGGAPDMLVMSRRTRRQITKLSRDAGSGIVQSDLDAFGRRVTFYADIPIGINDYISDDQTVGTSEDCSTVFAIRFGENGVSGITGPDGLEVDPIGPLETKDASRTRVKWYVALVNFNDLALAKLIGCRA
ncbi:MAG: major capsid protein [Dehalococcoidia bacterium]